MTTTVNKIELRNSTVFIKTAKSPGKTVLIMAGVHGNEPCGVSACKKILQELTIDQGKLIWIYANNAALAKNVRFVKYNLNRCFLNRQPPEMAASLEGTTARELMPYLDEADVLLDLHATYTPNSIPFVIGHESNREYARILPAETLLVNIDPFHPGSTDAYMNLQEKVALCMECGYLGDPAAEKVAENAITHWLISMGTIQGMQVRKNQRVYRVKGMYRNSATKFQKCREFPDFEKLNERTYIGTDGNREIWEDKDTVVLFVRNVEEASQECYLVAEEI